MFLLSFLHDLNGSFAAYFSRSLKGFLHSLKYFLQGIAASFKFERLSEPTPTLEHMPGERKKLEASPRQCIDVPSPLIPLFAAVFSRILGRRQSEKRGRETEKYSHIRVCKCGKMAFF